MPRKISATFSDGYVNSRTTTNPNLAFGYRVWSTHGPAQAELEKFVRSAREGFRKDRASAEKFVADSLESLRPRFPNLRGEVVPVVEL